MTTSKTIIIVGVAFLTIGSGAMADTVCTAFGNQTVCDDGTIMTRFGNQTVVQPPTARPGQAPRRDVICTQFGNQTVCN